jgi:subtilase family serine protease/subtilisin family serine protease
MKKQFLILGLVYVIIVMVSAQTPNGRLHPALEQKLQKLPPGEKLAVIVELNDQARPAEVISKMRGAGRREKARAVINALRSVADLHQGPLKAHLKQQQALGAAERVKPFWIINGFAVTAQESMIRELASRPEVKEVRLDVRVPLPSLLRVSRDGTAGINEWNLDAVRAPEVWGLDPSYNGTGVVIGSFDTGVDVTHPDLAPRYRGDHRISWFDPYREHSVPYDFHGHGTHTTGIAVGGDASGSSIGIAPGAVWIAAKAWDDSGTGLASAFHEIFEWFLAPGGDPDNAPDVVNNSWGLEESGCDTEFLPDIEAWRAAGIFPAFASGNSGPAPGSVRCPGAYPISFAVGATDASDGVADFSSQGPTPCDGSTKPDISAPGDGILSAVPGGYDIMSGTSMATPHITGAVAVLRSINPALTVDQLESAFVAGAKDLGVPGPDNASGAGRLDLFVSAQIAILGPDKPVVKVLATDAVATEAGATSGIFTVSRTGKTDADLEVTFSVGGTAAEGSDYESMVRSVTIPADQTAAEIRVTAMDDQLAELDETVLLTISPDPAYIVSGSNKAMVTIQSDELLSDLTVSALSVPAAAEAGQSIVLTETTKNQGAGPADPSSTQFYLSANSAYDGADTLIGTRSVETLPPGDASSASTTVTIPEGTAGGTWYLIARADGAAAIVETSETNNTLARSIKIGPDLVVTTLSMPSTAGAGQTITVTDTTKNQGGGAAGPSRTQFFLSTDTNLGGSDALMGARNVGTLQAGGTSSASATVTIPEGTAGGTWYLIAKADGEGTVPEISETNNTYAKFIQIGPDLAITALSAPGAAGAGQSITITDTTKNQGGGAAGPSRTQFFLSTDTSLGASDTLIGGRSVEGLASGASGSSSATILIPQGTAAGNWYIIAKADGEGTVVESLETNNTAARLIQIGPDLDIIALSAPGAAGAGQSVAISDTTKNLGGETAGPSRTEFLLSTDTAISPTDITLGNRAVPSLEPGGTSPGSTTVTIPQGTAPGSWYIIARADSDEALSEISERNNTSALAIKVGPDLDITALSAPGAAGAGQSIAVTDTTKNQGGDAAGPSRTRFFLSQDATLNASDIVLGNRAVPALAAAASSAGSTAVMIPEGTAAGGWYLIAEADGEEAVSEVSETNNTFALAIKVGPDLAVSALAAPATGGGGQDITITDTTKNQGGDAAGPSRTQYFLSTDTAFSASDVLLGSRGVPSLLAGAGSSGSVTVMIPAGTAVGNWYIIAKADAEEIVPETSETNNTSPKLIQLGPDLDITVLSAPGTAGAGQSITISDTTKNPGGETAGPSRTHFFLSADGSLSASDAWLGSRDLPSLAGGASHSGSVTVMIPAGTAVGNWYIIAKADAEETVVELSETNNTAAKLVQVGPDMSVAALSAPASAAGGQTITITDTTKNQGGDAAGPSRTHFFLSTDTNLDASDLLLGSRDVPSLPAGAASSGSTTVMIPQGTAVRTWYIIAKADGEGVVTETLETNNTSPRAFKVI